MAKRYGVLPSEVLNRPISELQIDFLCFDAGMREEERQYKEHERKMKQMQLKNNKRR